MKTIRHGRNARDQLLHIEADGVLVNIRVGLTDVEGHHVTHVSVSPEDASRGGDGTGYYWYQDGARIIRLHPGERPPNYMPEARWSTDGTPAELVCGHDSCDGLIDTMIENGYTLRWDIEFRGGKRVIANTNDDVSEGGDGNYLGRCVRFHINRLPEDATSNITWR
jgi:hypothetical protein